MVSRNAEWKQTNIEPLELLRNRQGLVDSQLGYR